MGRHILEDVRGKVLLVVAMAAVMGVYWGRPDLMVALLIVIAVGAYGWRHPDLDDWKGH
jgi:Co/Zn/Cd efflux system component